MLREAENEATRAMEREVQSLEHKKWLLVKTNLHEKMKAAKPKYSAQACQERFQALTDRTAVPPIELDANVEQRRADSRRRRQLRLNARRAADAQAEAEEAARREKRRAVHAERLERHRKHAIRRGRQLEKAANEVTKSQTRANIRADRLIQQNAEREKRTEKTGARVERIASAKLELVQKKATDKKTKLQEQAVARERAKQLKLERKLTGIKLDREFVIAELARPAERAQFANILAAHMGVADRPGSSAIDITADTHDAVSPGITRTVPSSQDIIADPRMRLTSRQLQNVLARYDPRVGHSGTKAELISRIQSAIASMTKRQLHTHLVEKNIDTSGSLSTLLQRNAEYDCLYSTANIVHEGVFSGKSLGVASETDKEMIGVGVSRKTVGGFVPFSMEC